jgi:hypothetical protein
LCHAVNHELKRAGYSFSSSEVTSDEATIGQPANSESAEDIQDLENSGVTETSTDPEESQSLDSVVEMSQRQLQTIHDELEMIVSSIRDREDVENIRKGFLRNFTMQWLKSKVAGVEFLLKQETIQGLLHDIETTKSTVQVVLSLVQLRIDCETR